MKRVRRPGEERETGEGCDLEGKLPRIVHDHCRFRDPPRERQTRCQRVDASTRRYAPRAGGHRAQAEEERRQAVAFLSDVLAPPRNDSTGRVNAARTIAPLLPPPSSFFVNALTHARTLCTLTAAALSPRKGAALESR